MSNHFFRFLPPLLLAFFTLSLTAQPATYFYRSWTTHSSHLPQDFTNHVVSVVNGTDTYIATSVSGATSGHELELSKYNARGAQVWSTTFTPYSGGEVYAGAITTDPSGNVLITGSAYNGATNGFDLYVVKFNSSGTKLWHQLYNGSGNFYDGGTAIVCNSSSYVFVTGGTSISATNIDVVTRCYNSSGTLQWSQTFDNAGYFDFGGGIGLHSTSVGITGFTQTSATNWEYLSIDYAQSGGTLGTSSYTSIGGTVIDRINATAFDASGNVYITGAMSTGSNGLDIKTVKLDASLNILWTATYDGSSHKDDVGRGIAVDGSGNVYVAGYFSASDQDGVLIKYSSSGTQSWAQTYDGGAGDDAFNDLAITSDTKIFVGGYTTQQDNRDFYTALYSSGGTKTWSDSQNGVDNRDDEIQQVVPDGLGNFVVSGPSHTSVTTQDVMTTLYGRDELVVPSDEFTHAPFIEQHGQKLGTGGDPVADLRFYS